MPTMNKLGRILMVEDDPKDVELTLTALEDYNLANEVVVTQTANGPSITCIVGANIRCAPATTRPSCCWI